MKKVKIEDLIETGQVLMSEIIMDTASGLNEAHFVVKLDEILKDRGLTQKELSQMTGIRLGTVSEIVNGKNMSINKIQIFAIMYALRIKNWSEIFEIRLTDTLEKQFDADRDEWKRDNEMPISVKEMYTQNILKASGLNKKK